VIIFILLAVLVFDDETFFSLRGRSHLLLLKILHAHLILQVRLLIDRLTFLIFLVLLGHLLHPFHLFVLKFFDLQHLLMVGAFDFMLERMEYDLKLLTIESTHA